MKKNKYKKKREKPYKYALENLQISHAHLIPSNHPTKWIIRVPNLMVLKNIWTEAIMLKINKNHPKKVNIKFTHYPELESAKLN